MYGLWPDKNIFVSTKQKLGTVPKQMMEDELKQIKRDHFKQKYQQKEFMEEMLKAKNMMGNMKR